MNFPYLNENLIYKFFYFKKYIYGVMSFIVLCTLKYMQKVRVASILWDGVVWRASLDKFCIEAMFSVYSVPVLIVLMDTSGSKVFNEVAFVRRPQV